MNKQLLNYLGFGLNLLSCILVISTFVYILVDSNSIGWPFLILAGLNLYLIVKIYKIIKEDNIFKQGGLNHEKESY